VDNANDPNNRRWTQTTRGRCKLRCSNPVAPRYHVAITLIVLLTLITLIVLLTLITLIVLLTLITLIKTNYLYNPNKPMILTRLSRVPGCL
jgi:hypothetical protein